MFSSRVKGYCFNKLIEFTLLLLNLSWRPPGESIKVTIVPLFRSYKHCYSDLLYSVSPWEAAAILIFRTTFHSLCFQTSAHWCSDKYFTSFSSTLIPSFPIYPHFIFRYTVRAIKRREIPCMQRWKDIIEEKKSKLGASAVLCVC